jgi:hypothetical protein
VVQQHGALGEALAARHRDVGGVERVDEGVAEVASLHADEAESEGDRRQRQVIDGLTDVGQPVPGSRAVEGVLVDPLSVGAVARPADRREPADPPAARDSAERSLQERRHEETRHRPGEVRAAAEEDVEGRAALRRREATQRHRDDEHQDESQHEQHDGASERGRDHRQDVRIDDALREAPAARYPTQPHPVRVQERGIAERRELGREEEEASGQAEERRKEGERQPPDEKGPHRLDHAAFHP